MIVARGFARALAIFMLLCIGANAEICVNTDEGASLVSRDGGEIIPFGTYDRIADITHGFYAVRSGGKLALMDGSGRIITDFLYNELRAAEDGLILARIGSDWGILNGDGTALFACGYAAITPAGDGTFFALTGSAHDIRSDRLHLLDGDGTDTETAHSVIEMGTRAEGGLIRVLSGDENLYGYCDVRGNMAIPAKYEYAADFSGGVAVITENGMYGAIDVRGEYVLAPVYDRIEAGNGFLLTRSGDEITMTDLRGEELMRTEGNSAWIAGRNCAVADEAAVTVYGARGAAISVLPPDAWVWAGIGNDFIASEGTWGEECVHIGGSDRLYQNLYAADDECYIYMQARTVRYRNDLLGETMISVDAASVRYGLTNEGSEPLTEAIYTEILPAEADRYIARTEEQLQLIDSTGCVYWQQDLPANETASSE